MKCLNNVGVSQDGPVKIARNVNPTGTVNMEPAWMTHGSAYVMTDGWDPTATAQPTLVHIVPITYAIQSPTNGKVLVMM